jgi:hypothetical protein
MRNAATHDAKDLAKQIALLRTQLDDLAETVNGTGNSLLHRGQETIEDGLRSARELLAKYSDTAKGMADNAVRLNRAAEGQGRRNDRHACRRAPVHHPRGNPRHRLPRRLAVSPALTAAFAAVLDRA